jgi:hypothetical protein
MFTTQCQNVQMFADLAERPPWIIFLGLPQITGSLCAEPVTNISMEDGRDVI